ncbi:hypothetical protein ACL2XG_23455 [Sodalis sp. RH24]|uniref:hypothetical protein n=1 Tax=unclassified Sodalis (in: enterobacteria) TaxID=2636512 RepID=UPI0039B69D0D
MTLKGLVLPCLFFFTTAIYAGESTNYQRGTRGLTPFLVVVNNTGHRPLDCEATTAHWYSVPLGAVAPGATLSTGLWKNIASGEVIILNDHQDRLPVQRFWCGEQGRSWQTRYEVALSTHRGESPRSLTLDCAGGADPIQCRVAPSGL